MNRFPLGSTAKPTGRFRQAEKTRTPFPTRPSAPCVVPATRPAYSAERGHSLRRLPTGLPQQRSSNSAVAVSNGSCASDQPFARLRDSVGVNADDTPDIAGLLRGPRRPTGRSWWTAACRPGWGLAAVGFGARLGRRTTTSLASPTCVQAGARRRQRCGVRGVLPAAATQVERARASDGRSPCGVLSGREIPAATTAVAPGLER